MVKNTFWGAELSSFCGCGFEEGWLRPRTGIVLIMWPPMDLQTHPRVYYKRDWMLGSMWSPKNAMTYQTEFHKCQGDLDGRAKVLESGLIVYVLNYRYSPHTPKRLYLEMLRAANKIGQLTSVGFSLVFWIYFSREQIIREDLGMGGFRRKGRGGNAFGS